MKRLEVKERHRKIDREIESKTERHKKVDREIESEREAQESR